MQENFKVSKILKKSVFIVLACSLILSACGNKTVTSENSESKTSSVSESSEISSTESTETESAETESTKVSSTTSTKTTSKKSTLNGTFTYTEQNNAVASVVEEILPVGNTANLSNPLTGYYDKEAEALRSEILNTENTAKLYKITGTIYYVSSINGDDLNDGTSSKAPIKSVEQISGFDLKEGDAVLFERGSTFRLYSAFNVKSGVIYGSYGTGEKPRIYGSPVNLATVEWTPSSKKNVWQMDYTYADCSSMFFEFGEQVGYRRTSMRKLAKNTDFYLDKSNNILYLYCDKGNPAKCYKSIEFGTQMKLINISSGVHDVVIDNLCLKYSGLFAVSATWNNSGITVTNCEIGYIGGGTTSDGNSRYGNAIQFWTGAKDIVVNHNWIYQTWDTAITWQGNNGDKYFYENIAFNYNLLEYNNADFEFWSDDSTITDFDIIGNIMRFTSAGWGTREDDGGYRGIDGCFDGDLAGMASVKNVVIKNNTIDSPARYILNLEVDATVYSNMTVSGTKVYVNPDMRSLDVILRSFIVSEEQENNAVATDTASLLKIMQYFDSTVVAKYK